jgi:PadR family transcriptional regulator, regulatory protein PadR
MRRTLQTLAVAAALMNEPQGTHWGYPLTRAAGVRSGVLYPILARMLDEGWLVDAWEDASRAASEGRPPRRYYRLTPQGAAALGGMLASTDMAVDGLALKVRGA